MYERGVGGGKGHISVVGGKQMAKAVRKKRGRRVV